MKRILVVVGIAYVLIGLMFGSMALGSKAVKGDDPAMKVSPHTIVLEKVDTLTVHTNIPCSTVETGTVRLETVDAEDVWADDCGDLAARFALTELELDPGDVTLTLCGSYKEDGTFAATDTVWVK
jgi:hypothetical protein